MRFGNKITGLLKTVFVSTMYASSLFIATGLPQVAMATTCNDLVPGTTIKYSDALVGFVYDGAKTYAIAKSAITGSLNLPDAFFAFASGIDRGYQYNGVDTASLKFLVTNGKYGAARPVLIDSKAKQDFITKQFLQYLGAAGSARSTYINAWKEFGANQQFTDITGAALPYTNWTGGVTPDTSTITAPQAVTMGSDGVWLNGENAQRISQVVEFDGKLDCAQDLNTPITPPLPPIPPPTDPNAIQGMICTQDLNLDGNISQNELQNCIKTPQGNFCPVGSLDCTATYQPAVCPAGTTLNTSRDMCQTDPSVQCPNGYAWDTSIDKCVVAPSCPGGGTYNSTTDRCEKLVNNVCPSGYTYDATRDVCAMPVNCGAGATFASTQDRCETPPAWICPTGYTFNAVTAKCEATPYCPPGTTYNTSRDRCESGLSTCPSGYSYNTVLDKCVVSVACPNGGTLNSVTNQCELTSGISCPTGFTYNSATGKCEQAPSCASPGSYNGTYDLCLAAVSGITCPTGYVWNAGYGTCIASPSCVGGSYNSATNRCEVAVTYSCSDSSYSYNSSTGRCEKAPPVCSGGSYNSTYDKCLQPMTPGCPGGYTYNSTRNRCEYQPPTCPNGTTYNSVTNKCEQVVSSSYLAQCTAGSLNQSNSKCEYTATKALSPSSCTPSSVWIAGGYVQVVVSCPQGSGGNTVVTCNDYSGCAASSQTTIAPNTDLSKPKVVNSCFGDYIQCTTGGCSYYEFDGACNCSSSRYLAATIPFGISVTTTYLCPNGGAPSGGTCQLTPSCPNGGTLQGNYCVSSSIQQSNPTCAGGNFDGTNDVCWANYSITCPTGMTYDSSIGFCTASAICTNGLLDGTKDVCYQAATAGCPGGYTPSGSICIANASCLSPGALDANIDYCITGASFSCPSGYSYSPTYGQCYQTAACGAGGLNPTTDNCETAYTRTCPTGYTLNGTVCQEAPPCPSGGSYSSSLKLCDGGSNVCSSPSLLDTGVDVCYQQASCGTGGSLNGATDKCEATATVNCSGWSWDSSIGACYSSPVCNLGSYNATANECQATITRDCGTYLWDATSTKCVQSVACPQDSAYPLNGTIKFDGTLDICASDVVHNCIDGTTYNGLPVLKCEAVPVCNNGAVRYDTTAHACYIGDNTCPLGSQYSCMDYNGKMQCSANSCFDQSNPAGGEVTTVMNESMYQDDARNPDGSCSGQIMIFAGKPSRCRPPGLKVGYINNCCKSDQVMSEDVGNSIQTGVTAIKTMYEIGQVAYYSYMVSTGAYTATAVGGVTTVATTAGATVTTLSGAVGSGVAAAGTAGAAGATTAGTMMASMQAYATALLNPATIAIAIVVMVVMKVLMGSGCDQTDIQTGGQVESKQCHYIGDYCEKKWPLFGCVQQAKGYCCFNSMMARIIHEQGRPQLTTFGADGAWGSPSAPNCRGFVPGEFESLDFAKIDMSEYFNVLQKDMATKIQNAQDAINNTIQQRTQQIQSGK